MGQFQPGTSGNPKGRPRKAEQFAGEITAAQRRIAHAFPRLVETLLRTALEGAPETHEDIDEEWVPVCLVTLRDSEGAELPVFAEGDPAINDQGMVCVKRKVKTTIRRRAADVRAAQDLLDRIMGKAGLAGEESAPDDQPVTIRVEYVEQPR